MAKKKLIIYDDQILIDMDLIFSAIREADGNWQSVEKEIRKFLKAMQSMGDDS